MHDRSDRTTLASNAVVGIIGAGRDAVYQCIARASASADDGFCQAVQFVQGQSQFLDHLAFRFVLGSIPAWFY